MENNLMPRQAHKSGSAQTLLAQQSQADIATITETPKPQTTEQIRAEIAVAQADMERAAKSLDFLAAARFRDRIQELEKLLLSK